MTTPEDKERQLNRREAKLEAKERELRLRELEIEVHREETKKAEVDSEPFYQTQKHQPKPNLIQTFGRKLVKFAKFAGFIVAGIALIKAGFLVGMWLTYFALTAIMAVISYQIFLKD